MEKANNCSYFKSYLGQNVTYHAVIQSSASAISHQPSIINRDPSDTSASAVLGRSPWNPQDLKNSSLIASLKQPAFA